jgi:hypothetical protein
VKINFIFVSVVLLFAAMLSAQTPEHTMRYPGVVSVEIGDGDINHELVCNIGWPDGVFIYDLTSGWHRITPDTADWLIGVQFGADDYEILGDFGPLGLWLWDYSGYPGTWIRLSPDDAIDAVVLDDDKDGRDEVHVSFGPIGLWRYDYEDKSWNLIREAYPSDGMICDFGIGGHEVSVWTYSDGTFSHYWNADSPRITKLTGDYVSNNFNGAANLLGDDSEEIFACFDPYGLWIYDDDNTPHWHQITGITPTGIKSVTFAGNTYQKLVAMFGVVDGLWIWNYSGWPGTWQRITGDNPDNRGWSELFDPDGLTETNRDEELAVDFNALGLWLYDNSATKKWTLLGDLCLHSYACPPVPSYMVRSDLNGVGVDTCLVVSFMGEGLWYYDGQTSTWYKIHDREPNWLF